MGHFYIWWNGFECWWFFVVVSGLIGGLLMSTHPASTQPCCSYSNSSRIIVCNSQNLDLFERLVVIQISKCLDHICFEHCILIINVSRIEFVMIIKVI